MKFSVAKSESVLRCGILQALTMITIHHGLVELPHDGDLIALGRGQGRHEDHCKGDDMNKDIHLSQRFGGD